MPVYKDNAQNRRLKRVGMSWGKECQPCKTKNKVLVGTSKKGETKYKVPKDPEKIKKLQKETKKLKSMVSPKSAPAPVPDVKKIQDAWRIHLDKDTGPIVNVDIYKVDYYLKMPKSFVLKNIIPDLNKGKSLQSIFREVDHLVRKKLKWGTDFQNMPGE